MILQPLSARRPSRRAMLAGLASAAGAGSLAACSSLAPEVPTTALTVSITADEQINPNEKGLPSPILLRIYELKSATVFQEASFFDLLDKDTGKLGADLVSKREFELKPGEATHYDRTAPVETRHVGVIAGFRQIEAAQWRAVVEITPEQASTLLIKISALAVTLTRRDERRTLGLF